jgi:delta endotoxin
VSVVESEGCRLFGETKELTIRKGFSGSGYVSLPSGNNGKIECSLPISTPGRYLVDLRIASNEDARVTVTVGAWRKTSSVSSTKEDNWTNSGWISFEVDLIEGVNTIVLTASETDHGAIDVDRFEATFKQAAQTIEGTTKDSSD